MRITTFITKCSIAVIMIIASGCTTISDLKPPTSKQEFHLDKDHYAVRRLGFNNDLVVHGLKAGRYTAVAEDAEGTYFQGDNPCVIVLQRQHAEEYLRTGRIPEEAIIARTFPKALGNGGIVLPKSGSIGKIRLFYIISNTTDGSFFGLAGIAIVSATEGALGYLDFQSDREFAEGLKISTFDDN